MNVYRLASGQYTHDLSGTGAKLYGGRWNMPGLPALYTAQHISLAVLEILVHLQAYRKPVDYHLVTIAIPDNAATFVLDPLQLKKQWKDDVGYTQLIGNDFLNTQASLVLKVPSAIIEQEHNIIINPVHPAADQVTIQLIQHFIFDKRLYLTNE